jgi:hypothetical protein
MALRKNTLAGFLLAGATAFIASAVAATDHIDGSITVNSPTIDLTDLYAFTAGEHQERLVVVLDIITATQAWERPDPSASFEIVFGTLTRDEGVSTLQLLAQPRYRLRCSWQAQIASCEGPNGTVDAPLGVVLDQAPLRLFAGLRSDPFVLNGVWASELAMNDSIPAPFDSNIIHGFNVYSLVAEIDIAALMPGLLGQAIALGAEVRDASGEQILDRIGRPEIANIALQSNTGPDLRDELNSFPALSLPDPFRSTVRTRVRENLDRYDAMDPTPYLSDKDVLAEILADDFLTIDPALPCDGARYFDLETAVLEGRQAENCGGRPLEQDIIDTVYGLLIRGSAYDPIVDGTATPTRTASASFPYLAAPNTGVNATVLALTGRGLSLLSVPGPGRVGVLIGIGVSVVALFVLLGIATRWMWRGAFRNSSARQTDEF